MMVSPLLVVEGANDANRVWPKPGGGLEAASTAASLNTKLAASGNIFGCIEAVGLVSMYLVMQQ
jgi:hypothetical protein